MNKISVIIPTRNRAPYLYNCLKSLSNQTEKPYEVVIADNHSTDSTKKIVSLFKKKLNIKYIFVNDIGICKTRNEAIKNISGNLIAFLDDDCVAFKNWIKNIEKNKSLLRKHYLLGFNYNKNYRNIFANYLYFLGLADVLNNLEKDFVIYSYFDTKNAIISKKQLNKLKPLFNEKFDKFHFGEDRELGIKLTSLGYSGKVIKNINVAHDYLTDLTSFIKKRFFAGRSITANKKFLEQTIKNSSPLNQKYEKSFSKKSKRMAYEQEKNKYLAKFLFIIDNYNQKKTIKKQSYLFLHLVDKLLVTCGMVCQRIIENYSYESKK